MAAYESVFIIRPDLDEETVSKVCDRITALIAANGGAVVTLEKMGHRHLAYEVKGFQDGYYVVLNYEGQAETTNELERNFRISDEVIRHLVVRKEISRRPAPAKAEGEKPAAQATPEAAAQATGQTTGRTAAPAPEAAPAEPKAEAKPKPEAKPETEPEAEGEQGTEA